MNEIHLCWNCANKNPPIYELNFILTLSVIMLFLLLCIPTVFAFSGPEDCPVNVYSRVPDNPKKSSFFIFKQDSHQWIYHVERVNFTTFTFRQEVYYEPNLYKINITRATNIKFFNLRWVAFVKNLKILTITDTDLKVFINSQPKCITEDIFENLETIDLSHNKIYFVNLNDFKFLKKLSFLDVSHNTIHYINNTDFETVDKDLYENLRTIIWPNTDTDCIKIVGTRLQKISTLDFIECKGSNTYHEVLKKSVCCLDHEFTSNYVLNYDRPDDHHYLWDQTAIVTKTIVKRRVNASILDPIEDEIAVVEISTPITTTTETKKFFEISTPITTKNVVEISTKTTPIETTVKTLIETTVKPKKEFNVTFFFVILFILCFISYLLYRRFHTNLVNMLQLQDMSIQNNTNDILMTSVNEKNVDKVIYSSINEKKNYVEKVDDDFSFYEKKTICM